MSEAPSLTEFAMSFLQAGCRFNKAEIKCLTALEPRPYQKPESLRFSGHSKRNRYCDGLSAALISPFFLCLISVAYFLEKIYGFQ